MYDDDASISVKRLIMSMYEGFRSDNNIRYVDIVNGNAALQTTIHRCVYIIHELYV